jgi:hypothetical protein
MMTALFTAIEDDLGGAPTAAAAADSRKPASKQAPTALLADPLFKDHLTGASHPERPERYDAVMKRSA